MAPLKLTEVTVATVLPFKADLSIDWASYDRLIDYCARPRGVEAVFVNGHAGEGATLKREERIEVIAHTRRRIGDEKTLLAGIIAYSTAEAIAQVRDAKEAGADVAVLFPFPQYGGGAGSDPDAGPAYVEAVTKAVDMPLSIFQYPVQTAGFSTEILVKLAKMKNIVAIKEGSNDIRIYEDNWRRIKAEAPHVLILPSNFDWFLAQLAVGADGVLSGLASLTPNLFVEMLAAMRANDLAAMRRASDRFYPIVRAIYGARPLMDMHTRIKVALQHLGVIDNPIPRPPLMPVRRDVDAAVRRTVDESSLAARKVA
jgi:4-hydroxy-tetrahydrodipicolinate synthase